MKKRQEYRANAQECRKLASTFPDGEQRQSLENMANVWDKMADEREAMVQIEGIEREDD